MNQSPFDRPEPKSGSPKLPIGILVGLLLFITGAAGLWLLTEYFPGQLSSEESKAHLVKLLLILTMVASGVMFVREFRFAEAFRNLVIWVGLAAVLIIGYSYREDLKAVGTRVVGELLPGQPMVSGEGVFTLRQSNDGHFNVTGLANGKRIRFMIDTGASDISLSPADARRLGIDPGTLNYTKRYQTANGMVRGAPYRLKTLSVGPVEFRDVTVSVNEADMNGSLLGMSFLNRLASFEISGQTMTLRQ